MDAANIVKAVVLALVEGARSAYVSGMGAVGLTIGILAATMVVLSAAKLRKSPGGGQPAADATQDAEAPQAAAKPVPSGESV